MTVHIYNCETVTVRSELVKRTKADGVFYGLRLHMNTDQAITFWSRTIEGLLTLTDSLEKTVCLSDPSEQATIPGQMVKR